MKRLKRILCICLTSIFIAQLGFPGIGFAAGNPDQPAPDKLRVEALDTSSGQPPIGYNEYDKYYVDLKSDGMVGPTNPPSPATVFLNYYTQAVSKPYKPVSAPELKDGNVPASMAPTDNSIRLKELDSGTVYYAYSRAYYSYTSGTGTYTSPESSNSNTVKFMTDIAIDAYSYGPNQIKIVWDDVWNSGKRMNYKLYISDNKDFKNTQPIYIDDSKIGQNGPVTVNQSSGKLEYVHTVSDPGRVYYIRIAPDTTETELKRSDYSPVVTVSSFILAKTTKMSTSSDGTIWKLEWSPVGTALGNTVKVSYQIYKGSTNGGNLEQYMASVDDTTFFLTVAPGDESSYYIIRASVTQDGQDVYPGVKIQSDYIYVKDSEVPSTPASPAIVDKFTNAGNTTVIISYQEQLKPDSATILWKAPKKGDGTVDEDISYDIWLIDDPNSLTNPPDSMLIASSVKMGESNYVMSGTQLLGYKYTVKDLIPNTTYYFKIVAKKSYVEFVNNKLQELTLGSVPAVKVIITPTNGPIDQPVIPGRPPLKIKKAPDKVTDMVTEDSAVIELKNKWYEEFEVPAGGSGSWVYITPGAISAAFADSVEHQNNTITDIFAQIETDNIVKLHSQADPTEFREFRMVKYDDGVTIDVGCTPYTQNIDYSKLDALPTNKLTGVSVTPNDPDEDLTADDALPDGKYHNIDITLTGLDPNTNYVVWVRATRASADLTSGPSDPIIVTTIPHIGSTIETPTVPVFNYNKAGDTYIDLGWNFNYSYTYYIKYSTKDDIASAQDTVTVTPDDLKFSSFYRITGLDPDTLYYFWIQAESVNQAGDTAQSEWSDSLPLKTLPFMPPATPKGFGVKSTPGSITIDSITYEWIPEDGLQYILEIASSIDYKDSTKFTIDGASEKKVSNLRSNFRYYARLYAYDPDKKLESEPTQSIIVRTLRSNNDYDSNEDVENVISGDYIIKDPAAVNHVWKISIVGVNADRFIEHVQNDNVLDYNIDLRSEPSGTDKIALTVAGKVFYSLSLLGENLMVQSDRNTLVFRPGTLKKAVSNTAEANTAEPVYVIGITLKSNTDGSNMTNLNFKTAVSGLDVGLAEGGSTTPVQAFEKPLKLLYEYQTPDWYKEGVTSGYILEPGSTSWTKHAATGSYNQDAGKGVLSFETSTAGRMSVGEPGMDYYNDIGSSWAKSSIAAVASVHKLNSVTGSSFKPNNYVTNADAAKFMLDMLDTKYSSNYMDIAGRAGLIASADAAKSDAQCTREKLVAMAMRMYEIKTSEKATSTSGGNGIFKDLSQVSSGLLPRIRFAAENGIITSRFSDTFGPKDPVTRAEAMVLLEKVLKYAGEL